MSINKNIYEKLIKCADQKGVYLVIRCQENKSRFLNCKNKKIDESSLVESKGTGIQAFQKTGHMGFSSVDTVSNEDRLFECLDQAISSSDVAKNNFEPVKEIFNLKPVQDKIVDKLEGNPFKVSQSKLQKDLFKIHNDFISKYPNESISNSVAFNDTNWRVFRSDKTDIRFELIYSFLNIYMHTGRDSEVNQIYENIHGKGYNLLHDEKKVRRLKRRIRFMYNLIKRYSKADRLKGGKYPLLIDSEIAGVFVHEAFGHTAESDNFYSDSPLLKNGQIDKGKKVANSYVNVFDYAGKEDFAYFPYSGYGVKRTKAEIVKNGKVYNLLSDVITAKKTSSDLTGASRMESYSDIPVPRMSSTQIELDNRHTIKLGFNHLITDIKMIQKVLRDKGIFKKYPEIIYLIGSRGGQVDQQKGNFQFGSIASVKLEEDKITYLKPLIFSGVTLEALRSAELAFGKKYTSIGVCGKSGQSVNVSKKAPLILLSPNKFITVS